MPKRTDIKKIMLIGSGPIVIGQACEFDYSGTQALKALKEEGYEVILVNSNPATIMTDPELADRTYIEPIEPGTVAKIIEKERPDALLPTLGGQTALNTALSVAKMGVLEKFGVELIGASVPVIEKAESRELFRAAMASGFIKAEPPRQFMDAPTCTWSRTRPTDSSMTDPELADRTYIEPIEPGTVAKIIEKERPDALLPTLGGQTALNTALSVAKMGVLEKFGVELIGASVPVIEKAESRELFRAAMAKIGLKVPQSGIAHTMDDVRRIGTELPFPLIIRPAFTMGGTGGGVAYNMEDLESISAQGLAASMKSEIMIEESVLGWKEFELEVMRDKKDNCVIICSIENMDAMGVHTGDSITVAPSQTLTDDEYQKMRDAALAIMREIGVETGGSNVQFAINPKNGDMIIVEMNPRVSRSSALASKATGFPIAKIAAKLAVGYTLDEIPNDITRETMASFEPSIDYCVIKIPRFTFEKFPGSEDYLTTSMKSVGETMAIGRTFKEALQKGLRSLEVGMPGLGKKFETCGIDRDELLRLMRKPNSTRLFAVRNAMMFRREWRPQSFGAAASAKVIKRGARFSLLAQCRAQKA